MDILNVTVIWSFLQGDQDSQNNEGGTTMDRVAKSLESTDSQESNTIGKEWLIKCSSSTLRTALHKKCQPRL